MNNSKRFRLIALLLLASVFLSACGGVFGASSWPGMTYDAENNLVYVAYNQGLFALQAENGARLWRFPGEASNSLTLYAAPQLDAAGDLIAGDYSNGLSSLNVANGALVWGFDQAEDRFIASPMIGDGQIFAPNADGKLYTLSDNGSLQWTFDSGEAIWSQPATDGEAVYLASMNHKLFALNTASGNQIWEQDLGGTVVSALNLAENGTLYVGTFNQEVLALSSANGRIQWRAATEGWVWGGVASGEGAVFAGDLEGNLYAFDSSTGRELWRVAAGGPIVGTPLVVNGHVIVGTENGQVLSVTVDGRIQWTQTYTGQAYSSPVAAGDLVLVGFVEGDALVRALDANGNTVWSFNAEN